VYQVRKNKQLNFDCLNIAENIHLYCNARDVNVLLGECGLCSKESDVWCCSTFWVYSRSQGLWFQCCF